MIIEQTLYLASCDFPDCQEASALGSSRNDLIKDLLDDGWQYLTRENILCPLHADMIDPSSLAGWHHPWETP
jgi:hypothetical protein